MLRRSTEPSTLPRDREQHIRPGQRVNLDHTSPLPTTRQTVEIGLITRRSRLTEFLGTNHRAGRDLRLVRDYWGPPRELSLSRAAR